MKTLREELEENFDALEGKEPVEPMEEPKEITEPKETEVKEEPKEPEIDPPQAWTGSMKEKWKELSPEFKAEIIRRENDFHKMVTSKEGEFRIGKELKEVLDTYMPDIKAAGAEPKALINDLLGTVSVLRNGSEEQKIQIMRNIAQGYGIDLSKVVQANLDPINMLYGELNTIKQQLNPQAIKSLLQQEQETARIQADISAFAGNTKNVHFPVVQDDMILHIQAIKAKSPDKAHSEVLQEAYDKACWANPSIRAEMQKAQNDELAAKKKQEMEAKKKASVSITGSPSAITGNPEAPNRSLRDELAANMAAARSSKI